MKQEAVGLSRLVELPALLQEVREFFQEVCSVVFRLCMLERQSEKVAALFSTWAVARRSLPACPRAGETLRMPTRQEEVSCGVMQSTPVLLEIDADSFMSLSQLLVAEVPKRRRFPECHAPGGNRCG